MNPTGDAPRIFSFIDWMGSRDRFEGARFDAVESFMLVAMVSHAGQLLLLESDLGWYAKSVFLPLLLMSSLVGLSSQSAKPYCVIATFGVASAWLVVAWPVFANHTFLEWSILLFLILCRGDKQLGLNALRWLVVIVLFHSGLQKMVMGQYFEGQFLAAKIAIELNFSDFFGILISDAEIERLVAMGGRPGTGPYTSANPIFLVISNAVWIAEMGVAVLLTVPRCRSVGMWGAIALVVGIELGAREVVFGCLFVFLILMFHEGRRAFALWPALAGLQILAMLSRYALPGLRFN